MLEMSDKVVDRRNGFFRLLRDFAIYRTLQAAIAHVQSSLRFLQIFISSHVPQSFCARDVIVVRTPEEIFAYLGQDWNPGFCR